MSINKNNSDQSVRKLWTKQRKSEGLPVSAAKADRGSHFAVPAPVVDAEPASKPAPAAGMHRHAHLKITGASGEMPKVPVRVRKADVDSYSRYNTRYIGENPATGDGSARRGGFATTPAEGQPAYSWKPFVLYGGIAAIVTLLWVAVAKLVQTGPVVPGTPLFTLGIALLCLIVFSGFVLIAVTVSLTKRTDPELMTADVAASALGKGACVLLVGVGVWIAASAVLTLLVL